MRIQKRNPTTSDEAIIRIDRFLDDLLRKSFPGATIKEASKSWQGRVLSFSFKAKKGILGTTINGTITVTDQTIVLESQLPGLVATFVSEEKIAEVINREFDVIFS